MPKKTKKERSRSKNKNQPSQQKSITPSKNKKKLQKTKIETSKELKSDSQIENPKELNEESTNNISSDLKIDINKQWQTHYDPHYSRNFYYNPFTNESVWELPPNASLSKYENPQNYQNSENEIKNNLEIKNEDNNDKNKKTQKKNFLSSYQEIESIPENQLQKILEYKAFKSSQLSEWMSRPARQQVKDTRKETAYIEGNYDYNIWYDKYLTDRKEEKEKIPAEHKCIPSLDTGYTRADKQEKNGSSYFCLFFAKGCCSEGVNCRYYHRVPTFEECEKIENSRDIFGRSRFYAPLKDNGGIGVFTKECRTIYVYDLKKVETKNPVKDMVRIIYENFSPWGEIENMNYIHVKSACYIKYSHRCSAEFAKEAMMRQSLVGEEILSIKWAFNETDPEMKKIREREEENLFVGAVQKKAVEYQESNIDYAQEKYLKLKEVFKTIEENKKNDFDGD